MDHTERWLTLFTLAIGRLRPDSRTQCVVLFSDIVIVYFVDPKTVSHSINHRRLRSKLTAPQRTRKRSVDLGNTRWES
jgi:hypothetical protein